MPELASVVIVGNDDDWEGIYINGKLVQEGHSLCVTDVLDALLGKTLTDYEDRVCDDDWLEAFGSLPDSLEDVKWRIPQ